MAYRNMTNAEYKKQRYSNFAARGLCSRCGKKPPEPKKKFCYECRQHFRRIQGTPTHAEYQRQWRKTDKGRLSTTKATLRWRAKSVENKAKSLATAARYRRKLRFDVMSHYGDHCVCCGETNKFFLSLDHINNDGKAHRLTVGKGKFSSGGANFFRHVRNAGYPPHLQILCFNCNHAKAFYGSCPHTQAGLSVSPCR